MCSTSYKAYIILIQELCEAYTPSVVSAISGLSLAAVCRIRRGEGNSADIEPLFSLLCSAYNLDEAKILSPFTFTG